MSDLSFKVYLRRQGGTKKDLRAKFCDLTSAVNYAFAESVGRFKQPGVSLIVMNQYNRVERRYVMGDLQ